MIFKIFKKEYFPNLLESTLLCQSFVFWIRDFKLWLVATCLLCKISVKLDNIDIRHLIRKGPPYEFLVYYKTKKQNVVQSYWNFAQSKEIKIWSLKKQRLGTTMHFPEDLEYTPFKIFTFFEQFNCRRNKRKYNFLNF